MGVGREDERDDDELLLAAAQGDGVAFGAFYERHLAAVVAFARRRSAGAEAAADLTAEVFAAALVACSRYRPGETPALAWLLGIARNKLRESARRGRRGAEARRRLGLADIPFAEEDVAGVEALVDAGSAILAHLEELPEEQRSAVWGRVVDERDYGELAGDLGCSEELVRQRVSRGLRRLRARLENEK
jgi:RNA polymerase sigma factor (sigma-70 family)